MDVKTGKIWKSPDEVSGKILSEHIINAHQALQGLFRRALSEYKLTKAQWGVMEIIARNDGIEIIEIARKTNYKQPGVSRIISNFRNRNVISENIHLDDKRRRLITLNESGMALYKTINELSIDIYSLISYSVDVKDSKALLDQLNKFTDNINKSSL